MDFNQLRNEARANIETHLQHILPIEYQLCMAGINQLLKIAWKISGGFNIKINDNNHDSGKTAALDDSKTRLHALALANDCYKCRMDHVTNGVVIIYAIKFAQQKKK